MREKREIKIFLLVMAFFAAACWLRYFDHTINPQDTTAFAFSYRYGFISRGLMGSLLELAGHLTGMDLMTYETVYAWSTVATLLFFCCLFGFFAAVLTRCEGRELRRQQYLIILTAVFAFPMFVTEENFGRLDVYLTILMLLCMILLIRGRREWLVPPLCCLGVLIHQGFVFMNVNIVLVLLFYKWLKSGGKKRRYYFLLLAVTFVAASSLFVYFEFFSHVNGTRIYDEVVENAKQLAVDGETYSTALVNHEILGEGVFMDEWFFHKINYVELPQFLLVFLPYIWIAVRFGKDLFSRATGGRDRWIFAAVALGAWTVLPEFVLKVDYGRYLYSIVFYYLAMILSLTALGDGQVKDALGDMEARLTKKMYAPAILIVYPMILMPFLDVVISQINVVLCGFMPSLMEW